MKKLKRNAGYTLLEVLLSSAIFMLCISMVLLGVALYSRYIDEQIHQSSESLSEIRFIRIFCKDISKVGVYSENSGEVAFSSRDGVPVIMGHGIQLDSESGMFVQTDIEYQFRAKEIVRSEIASNSGNLNSMRFKVSSVVWKTLCLEEYYENGNVENLTVGDNGSFLWNPDIKKVIVKLGPHSRIFSRSEFVD